MSQLTDQAGEMEELRAVVEGRKQDQKKLAAGMSEIEQLNQSVERYEVCMYSNFTNKTVVCVSVCMSLSLSLYLYIIVPMIIMSPVLRNE